MNTHLIDIHSIIIPPNRQRREFDPVQIEKLAASIVDKGLMHPIVVANDGETLVAGERRLRAVGLIHQGGGTFECGGVPIAPGLIPAVPLGELSPLALREAELEENTIRVDLSMPERVRATAELHELRKAQNPGQTFKDTASEIEGHPAAGSQIARVSDAVIIAQHLDNPAVAKAESEREAMKIIRREMEDMLRGAMAEQQTDQPESPHDLIQGDAIGEVLPGLGSAQFDIILTDPPYGIDASAFGTQAFRSHKYDDDFHTWLDLMAGLAEQGFRVTKPQAHAYVFCDPRNFTPLSNIFATAGWRVWPTPIIWDKASGMLPRPEHGPRRCYEMILFANKGEKKVNAVYSDVIRVPAVAEREHAAEKPMDLYVDLLRRSAIPGDSVLDPFCGSGTIFPAANRARCYATGIELDAGFARSAQLRMGE